MVFVDFLMIFLDFVSVFALLLKIRFKRGNISVFLVVLGVRAPPKLLRRKRSSTLSGI
jgi:hypothetical protein